MRNRKLFFQSSFFALALAAVPGCGSDDADADPNGSCTVADLGDGTSAIRCPDGTELVVSNGKDGKDGTDGDKGDKGDDAACTLDEVDGKYTLTCGSDSVVIGDSCEDGFMGNVFVGNTDQVGANSLTLFQVSNCTWIRGNLLISSDAEELPKVLSRIEKVDGDVRIGYNDNLEKAELPALTTVQGDLVIRYNDALESVAFPALKTIGGYVDIYENESLTDMDFGSLTAIAESLWIFDNAALSKLVAFPALKTIGGNVDIYDNESLTEMDFGSLTTIVEGLGIYDNAALPKLDGFPALEEVGGWLTISDNASLETVSNFEALTTVGGIRLWWNDSLESIAEFPALEEIAGFGEGPSASYSLLYIADHAVLSSVGKLGTLDAIDGNVTFENNPELEQSDIDALLEDIDISGSVDFCGNKGGDSC